MSGLPIEFIDISLPLRTGIPVWPGDQPYERSLVLDREHGDACTLSKMTLSCHTGTHMDAPLHFIRGGATIDELPLDVSIGAARVIDPGEAPTITRAELLRHSIRRGERVLFRTRNSHRRSLAAFDEHYVFLEPDAAAFLADCAVRLVGIDGPSVGGFQQGGPETHHTLLGAGIWIVENLDLSEVESGQYQLICLPLRLMGAEGAPARAVLRRL